MNRANITPMSEYTFIDGLSYSMAELGEMDNQSFREYYFPIQNTPLDMAHYCQYNDVDLGNTVIMQDGETFVGMSMLATRGKRGYVAGFGIVPEYRGKGAGRIMMARQLEVARAANLRQLQLEVLAQNARAQRLYEGAGFKSQRAVVGLKIATGAIEQHVTSARITATEPELIMDWLMQGQKPAWSRERASLLVTGGNALVVSRPGGATAAMLYRRRGEGGKRLQIDAVALIDRTSTNDFLALLYQAAEGADEIAVHNEPEGTTLYQICKDLGFDEEYRQYEMVVEL